MNSTIHLTLAGEVSLSRAESGAEQCLAPDSRGTRRSPARELAVQMGGNVTTQPSGHNEGVLSHRQSVPAEVSPWTA